MNGVAVGEADPRLAVALLVVAELEQQVERTRWLPGSAMPGRLEAIGPLR